MLAVARHTLVLATITLLSGWVGAAPAAGEEPLHRQVRAAGCRLSNGNMVADGENFTRSSTGPCISYLCQNGSVLPLDYKCFRDGKCYPLNDVHRLACIERTCQLTQGRFDYVISKEACTGRNPSMCIEVGTTVKDGCFSYRCDKVQESPYSVSYHLKQVDFGCEFNGQCVPANRTVTQGCRTMQCQKKYGAVGFFTISDGCEIDGQCVDVGSSVVQACRTLSCVEENLQGLRVLNVKPTKIQCKDTNDVCHDSGSFFQIEVNQQQVNCTCDVQGLNVEYSCPSVQG